jgi:hypothetical protein
MTSQRFSSRTYIQARQAWWAGDIDYSLAILERGGVTKTHDAEASEFDPLGMVRIRAAELYTHLTDGGFPRPENDFILETDHLRGAFHQSAERHFELRAFLTDLSWDKEFLRRSRVLAKLRHIPRSEVMRDQKAEVIGEFGDPELSWTEVRDNMLLETTVSGFAVVRVYGTWIGKEPPTSLEPIRLAFKKPQRAAASATEAAAPCSLGAVCPCPSG